MNRELFLIVTILFFSAAALMVLAAISFRRMVHVGLPAGYLAAVFLLSSVYSFGYAMELLSVQITQMLFWVKVEHICTQWVSPTLLLFALSLTGREKWITWKRILVLFFLPTGFLLASWTNEFHHLVIGASSFISTEGLFPILHITGGPLYWPAIGYTSLCLLITIIFVAQMIIISPPSFRRQAILFFIAALMPGIGMAFYITGNTPYRLDFSPLFIIVSGLISIYGFTRGHLLEIIPVARDLIFENMQDGMLILDQNDRLVDFNHAIPQILPDVTRAHIGKPLKTILINHPEILAQVTGKSEKAIELQFQTMGQTTFYQSTISPVINRHHKVIGKIVALHDYTQTKQLIEEMRDIATRDYLTGIYNRRHFSELAATELYRASRYGSELSLIIFDIDHFKRVNDYYGHAAGDIVLKNVAQVCKRTIRQCDILARFGGEEFILLLPETGLDTAMRLAERLREALEQTITTYEGQSIQVTASFGVTSLSSPAETILDTLIRQADALTYEAKNQGRNRVCKQ